MKLCGQIRCRTFYLPAYICTFILATFIQQRNDPNGLMWLYGADGVTPEYHMFHQHAAVCINDSPLKHTGTHVWGTSAPYASYAPCALHCPAHFILYCLPLLHAAHCAHCARCTLHATATATVWIKDECTNNRPFAMHSQVMAYHLILCIGNV